MRTAQQNARARQVQQSTEIPPSTTLPISEMIAVKNQRSHSRRRLSSHHCQYAKSWISHDASMNTTLSLLRIHLRIYLTILFLISLPAPPHPLHIPMSRRYCHSHSVIVLQSRDEKSDSCIILQLYSKMFHLLVLFGLLSLRFCLPFLDYYLFDL